MSQSQSLEIRKLTGQDAAAADEHRNATIEAAAQRIGSPPAGGFVVGAFQQETLIGVAGFHREQELKSRHKGRVWGDVTAAGRRRASDGP